MFLRHTVVGLLCVWAKLLVLATACWSEQATLIVQVSDIQKRPVSGIEIVVDKATEPGRTVATGFVFIRLAPEIKANEWVSLQIIKSPPGKAFVIISPWDSRIQIPAFDNNTAPFVSVIVGNRGEPALLENEAALATIAAKINKASSPTTKATDAEKQRQASLESISKEFGYASADVDKAIRAWRKKIKDPYEEGLAALYEKNYAFASQKFAESLEIHGKDSMKVRRESIDAAFFLGRSKYDEGKYEESITAYREAQDLRPDDPFILNNLALSMDMAGDYAGAEPLYRRALDIDEQTLGSDHLKVSGDLSNLATLLRSKGDLRGAEPIYRRILEIDEKVLGHEHPKVATDLNDLALLLQAQGNYTEAEPLYWRARSIDENVLGPENGMVARDLGNLASLLQTIGDNGGAERMYQRVLAIDEKTLGPAHAKIGTDLGKLASVLQAKGNLPEAEILYRRALAIDEQALGRDHPAVGKDLYSLAQLLQAKGDFAAAESLYQRALTIDEKALGPDHPEVQMIRHDLEQLTGKRGRESGKPR